MRIYVMTDLEGVCGVMNYRDWCEPQSRYYEKAKELLTAEVNVAIEGFVAGGATEILVLDGHGHGGVEAARLHAAATLMRGWPSGWPFLLEKGRYDAVAYVGQHAKAGTTFAHLAHTGSFATREESINDVSIGEFGAFALCAGELDIPVIFVSGDEAFVQEAQSLVPGVETVAVKRGMQSDPGHALPAEGYARHNTAAIHLSPQEACRRIRVGAQRAIERSRSESFGVVKLAAPYRRVRIMRSDELNPPRVSRTEHPHRIASLLNEPFRFDSIQGIDPLEYAGGGHL